MATAASNAASAEPSGPETASEAVTQSTGRMRLPPDRTAWRMAAWSADAGRDSSEDGRTLARASSTRDRCKSM